MRRASLAVCALVAACGTPRPVTAILVTVTADDAVRAELVSLRIRVESGAQGQPRIEAYAETRAAAELAWPVELPVVPREDDASRAFEVEVAALGASGAPIVVSRIATSFVRGEVRRLSVHLDASCARIACDGGTSCVAGACAPVSFVDPRDLPLLDGGVAGHDAGERMDAVASDAGADGGALDGGEGDLVTLTVRKHPASTGAGTLSFDVGASDCASGCTEQRVRVARGTLVNIAARPDPGSFFQDWSGATCAGPHRFCSVRADGDQTLTATFALHDHNLVFATSERFAGDFGGVAVADAHCERLARGVGLSGTFVAMLSEPGTNAIDRLRVPGATTPARGFVRMDGRPIADTVEDLTVNRRVWYPIHFDENGAAHDAYTWSGTTFDGRVSASHCDGWTSRDGDTDAVRGTWGDSGGGPEWLEYFDWQCSATNSLVCVQIDHDAAVSAPAPTSGKVMWLSRAQFTPGAGGVSAANALCDAERPAGVTSARALLATTSAPASSLLDADVLYVRPDGVPIGTRDELIAGTLRSGNWVHADGSYELVNWGNWTGSLSVGVPAASGEENCSDWTSTAPTASLVGSPTSSGRGVAVLGETGWWGRTEDRCEWGHPITCFER